MDWLVQSEKSARVPLFMGILNATPDSFSDGLGIEKNAVETLAARGMALLADGADILDVGGESTRPGFAPVAEAEELRRTIPVVRRLAEMTNRPISIDTTKAAVAEEAMANGASIINDVSSGTFDPTMAEVAARRGATVCLGHVFWEKKSLHQIAVWEDVVAEVVRFLAERREAFLAAGVLPEKIILDPGIGFGKTADQNLEILNGIDRVLALGSPVLVGHSRKRFLGGESIPERDEKTAEWSVRLAHSGVTILRVHQVALNLQRVLDRHHGRRRSIPQLPS